MFSFFYSHRYLNLRHAWLPWMRVRIHLHRLRHLERQFASIVVSHLALAIGALVLTAGLAAARIYTSPYQDIHSAPTACLVRYFIYACVGNWFE